MHTVEAVRQMRYVHVDGDAVFTLGSIGVEKAMKVILGCRTLAGTGSWPSKSVLCSWGHDIEKLSSQLQKAIAEGLAQTTAPGYSQQLAEWLRENSTIPLVFAALARYGRSGRFHHLDILATDEPGEFDQPSEYWERVEQHVQQSVPEFSSVPFHDSVALNNYRRRRREYIADNLEAWWFCVHRLGVQGCFGDLGKKIGWEIWVPGRPTPQLLKEQLR
ncbi:hypothetical protein [Micrococcus luteus]|uniref:hypothetical protein n=1 Tax=Micrococcus luteus TaxID=1270 RepID=UPI0011AECE08|nr:hypothetical protein [Micrococcus luteus]